MSSSPGVRRLHSRGRPPAQPCAKVGAAKGYVLMNPGSLGKRTNKQGPGWQTLSLVYIRPHSWFIFCSTSCVSWVSFCLLHSEEMPPRPGKHMLQVILYHTYVFLLNQQAASVFILCCRKRKSCLTALSVVFKAFPESATLLTIWMQNCSVRSKIKRVFNPFLVATVFPMQVARTDIFPCSFFMIQEKYKCIILYINIK